MILKVIYILERTGGETIAVRNSNLEPRLSIPDFVFPKPQDKIQTGKLRFKGKEIWAEFISQITSAIDNKVSYNLPCNCGDSVYELCLEEDISIVEHPILE